MIWCVQISIIVIIIIITIMSGWDITGKDHNFYRKYIKVPWKVI